MNGLRCEGVINGGSSEYIISVNGSCNLAGGRLAVSADSIAVNPDDIQVRYSEIVTQPTAILTRCPPNRRTGSNRSGGVKNVSDIGAVGLHAESVLERQREIQIDQRVASQHVDGHRFEHRSIGSAGVGILRCVGEPFD